MSTRPTQLSFNFTRRIAPRRGPAPSDTWNDSIDEISAAFASIQRQWNTYFLPLLDTVPNGDLDTNVDAFKTGLDGSTLYLDEDADGTSDYYNLSRARPSTVKEALDDIYAYISTEIGTVNDAIADVSNGLTSAQKAAIGSHIFDASLTSSSSSLDGKSETGRLNILQLAKDMYGSTFALDGDGVANLTNSIADMVDALLELHGGNWSDDATVSHASITAATQLTVGNSATYDDAYAGTPANTEDDLNQIRTQLKKVGGGTNWTSAPTALYAGGPDSLEDLLTATQGSGTKTSSNPFGYRFNDIDDHRYQEAFSGITKTITHNRAAYPVVDIIQLDPAVTLSGEVPFTVNHTSTNAFTVTITSGVLVDGYILAIW